MNRSATGLLMTRICFAIVSIVCGTIRPLGDFVSSYNHVMSVFGTDNFSYQSTFSIISETFPRAWCKVQNYPWTNRHHDFFLSLTNFLFPYSDISESSFSDRYRGINLLFGLISPSKEKPLGRPFINIHASGWNWIYILPAIDEVTWGCQEHDVGKPTLRTP